MSVLKCVTACWFSTWRVKRASIFSLILYPSNNDDSRILALMEMRDFFRSSRDFKHLFTAYWIQYTNVVDRKSGPFGGNLDKNAKNWLEQGALAIFWRFLTPGNKWCLDWSWFQTIYPIPIFDILFPFPVTKSQSQWLKSHFPRAKTGQSQFPFYPFTAFRTLCCGRLTLFLSRKLLLLLFERSAPILIQQTIWEWSENMFGCYSLH